MLPALVPAETVRAVVPRVTVPPLRVVTEEVAPLRFSVPVVRVPIVAAPLTVVDPLLLLKVVIEAAPVMVFVPPVTEVELSEPALTVPPPRVPVSRPVEVTLPPVILPVRVPAVTVPLETAAVSRPTTVTVPVLMPPVMAASLPKRVEPAPAREVRVMTPLPLVKLRELSVASLLVTAPVMVRPEPLIVAVPVVSRVRLAAAP